MLTKNKPLKELLLLHQFAFILLISLAAAAGAYGIHLWEKSSQEAARISALVSEVQQTRGDLYRQMKELFDAYFLDDATANEEYAAYTVTVEKHFERLNTLAIGEAEKKAIADLHQSYQQFVTETPDLFTQHQRNNNLQSRHALNTGVETGVFSHYESLLADTEKLFNQKKLGLNDQLIKTKQTASFFLISPMLLAVLLLIFSRVFLNRAIVKPINAVLQATAEISAGNLHHKAPEEGVAELIRVSQAINSMATKLEDSQEALVRTEKQAAQGSLVPMLAHNIRNPLASIRATAQVLDDPAYDAETRELLHGIVSTVDRLERWTGALLAYLLPLKPQANHTNVQTIVEGALGPLQQKLKEKTIQLTLPNWPTDTSIYTDQHLLEQVIYNLLLNAVDASKLEGKIEVKLNILAHTYLIHLLDRGTGMPFKPDPSAVSAPTTKRFGTGIGIPFAFKVCDALDAELKFEAREGGGTAITILLPKVLTEPTQ